MRICSTPAVVPRCCYSPAAVLCEKQNAFPGRAGRSRGTGTCSSSVVGNVGGQVDALAVDEEVSHASHKVPVSDGEVFWQVGDPSKEQGTCEVQGPAGSEAQGFKRYSDLTSVSSPVHRAGITSSGTGTHSQGPGWEGLAPQGTTPPHRQFQGTHFFELVCTPSAAQE